VRIEVITTWKNEAALAPFFLDHYRYVDKINVILDAGTTDDTLAICARQPNVSVDALLVPEGPAGFEAKLERQNAVYRSLVHCDWVFAVDSDEFLFPIPWGTNPRPALNLEHDFDVVPVRMFQVHRHRADADLDPLKPAVPQRRHGSAVTGTAGERTQPLIVRGGLDGEWSPGRLTFGKPGLRVSPRVFGCAHWAKADLPPGPERNRYLDDPQLF
jgi:hypothetical protein